MFTKLISYLTPSDKKIEQSNVPVLSKLEQKHQEIIKIIDQNEYFQHPETLKEDLSFLISVFISDQIDIYIDSSDESLLQIIGFVEIVLKKKKIQIALYFTFNHSYPDQICDIRIENQSFIDRDVKLSAYYSLNISEKFISLNSYLVQSKIWLNHRSIKQIIEETQTLLTNHFPFYKPKKKEQFFSLEIQNNNQKFEDQQDANKKETQPQMQKENEQNKEEIQTIKNQIVPPLILQQTNVYGPTGLLLVEENQLQQKITKFSIEVMRQHRNDINHLKQQQQEMAIQKQQQDGVRNQVIWIRQYLDIELEAQACQLKFYNQQLEINKIQQEQHIIERYIQFDDCSNQICDIISEIKSIQDGFIYLSKLFRSGLINYNYRQMNCQNKSLNKNYQ